MLVSFLLRPASCLGFCLNIIANYFNLGPIPRMISDRKLNIILIYHKICRKNFKFRLFLQNIIWQCQKQCNFTFWKILSVPRQCNLKFCQCQGSKPSGNPDFYPRNLSVIRKRKKVLQKGNGRRINP